MKTFHSQPLPLICVSLHCASLAFTKIPTEDGSAFRGSIKTLTTIRKNTMQSRERPLVYPR